MTSQTINVGLGTGGNTARVSVHGLGLSKDGTKGKRRGGLAFGHDLPISRAVVMSAAYNQRNDPNAPHSYSLPDATGDFTINPANGFPLSHPDNAALLEFQKVDGDYVFGGFVVAGENCFNCDCAPCAKQYPSCPVGNPDLYLRDNIGKSGSNVTVSLRHDYIRVLSIEELKVGDKLSLVDDGQLGDCLKLLGSVAKAGTGALDLPERIEVTEVHGQVETGAYLVEIYTGG